MMCDHCHERPASMVITQLVDEKAVKMYLCDHCASENETYLSQMNPFQEFLGAVFEPTSNQNISDIQCKGCGMTMDLFKKTSKIGCAQCYSTFDGYLKSIFKQIHGNTRHIGKRPVKMEQQIQLIKQINDLQLQLQEAIHLEDYEAAAKLRDTIKAVKLEYDTMGE